MDVCSAKKSGPRSLSVRPSNCDHDCHNAEFAAEMSTIRDIANAFGAKGRAASSMEIYGFRAFAFRIKNCTKQRPYGADKRVG